jgi:hypothetical protein
MRRAHARKKLHIVQAKPSWKDALEYLERTLPRSRDSTAKMLRDTLELAGRDIARTTNRKRTIQLTRLARACKDGLTKIGERHASTHF